MENEAYQPVKDYIQKHSMDETTILSICGGAVNLAHAGLLDGKSAATHWADQIGKIILKSTGYAINAMWWTAISYLPQD